MLTLPFCTDAVSTMKLFLNDSWKRVCTRTQMILILVQCYETPSSSLSVTFYTWSCAKHLIVLKRKIGPASSYFEVKKIPSSWCHLYVLNPR